MEIAAKIAEGMNVAVAHAAPVDEFDPQFECRARLAEKFVLGNVEHAVEVADRRDGRFAHADGADLARFD